MIGEGCLFKMLTPIDINLTSSNVAEDDYTEWSSATSYALTNRVMVQAEHKVYESLQDANLNLTPSSNPDSWVLVGATNRHKFQDEKISSQTVRGSSIEMTFPSMGSTAIAFINTSCETLKVEMFDGATKIFEKTAQGSSRVSNGWYDYFFGTFVDSSYFIFEHPIVPTSTYKVTATGGLCAIGVMLIGRYFEIGLTQWGAAMGFYDYSKKEPDEWGEIFLKQGNFRDYFKGEVEIKTARLSAVRKKFIERRGKLSLFVPSTSYDMAVYGFLKEPELIWENPKVSVCTLDVEGVI